MLAGFRPGSADVEFEIGFFGDDVFCVAGVESGDGYDGEVEGIDFAGDDGLETQDGGRGLDDGVDAAMGGGGVGLTPCDFESVATSVLEGSIMGLSDVLERIRRTSNQPSLRANNPSSFRHDVRSDNDIRDRNFVVKTIVDHCLCTPCSFFRRLENQNQRSTPCILRVSQCLRCAQQCSDVHVVSTSMHDVLLYAF